jgi:hypothetical protein
MVVNIPVDFVFIFVLKVVEMVEIESRILPILIMVVWCPHQKMGIQ